MEEWKVTAMPSDLRYQKVVGWPTHPNGNFGTLFLPFFRKMAISALYFAISPSRPAKWQLWYPIFAIFSENSNFSPSVLLFTKQPLLLHRQVAAIRALRQASSGHTRWNTTEMSGGFCLSWIRWVVRFFRTTDNSLLFSAEIAVS